MCAKDLSLSFFPLRVPRIDRSTVLVHTHTWACNEQHKINKYATTTKPKNSDVKCDNGHSSQSIFSPVYRTAQTNKQTEKKNKTAKRHFTHLQLQAKYTLATTCFCCCCWMHDACVCCTVCAVCVFGEIRPNGISHSANSYCPHGNANHNSVLLHAPSRDPKMSIRYKYKILALWCVLCCVCTKGKSKEVIHAFIKTKVTTNGPARNNIT